MLEEQLSIALENLSSVWWFVSLVLSVLILREFWLVKIVYRYIQNIKWITLEVHIPRGNIKSIRSMEQVIASLYGIYSYGLRLWERIIEGKVESWISLEIVGHAHSVHFYIRAPEQYRKLIESAFFAQYPDVEINEVQDYTLSVPQNLPNEEYDIFGTDFMLARDDAYPIKTYREFEFERLVDEEKELDPIANIAEVVSSLEHNEMVWLQLLIRPKDRSWIESAEVKEIIDKLSGRGGQQKKKGLIPITGEFARNLVTAPMVHPEWGDEVKETPAPKQSTQRESDVLKAVQTKLSKKPFDTILRFIYIDKKDDFTGYNVSAVLSSIIEQFSVLDRNSFRPNRKTFTKKTVVTKIPIPALRRRLLLKRKKKIFQHYLDRTILQKPHIPFQLDMKMSVLSSEELASIFHPPILAVKAPKLQPVETRKGEPPIDLPIKE
jgi:hypothetical protein